MTSFLGKKDRVTLSIGFTYILVGVFLELGVALFNVAWAVRYPTTAASFVLIVIGGLTIVLYAPVKVATVLARASEEGLTVSDADRNELVRAMRDCRKLLTGVLTVYTIVFMLHIYYLDSIRFFPDSDFAFAYISSVYAFPVFIVIPMVLAYVNYRHHRGVSHIYIKIGSTKSRKS